MGPLPGGWKKNSTLVPIMSENDSLSAPDSLTYSSRDAKSVTPCVSSWATTSSAPET